MNLLVEQARKGDNEARGKLIEAKLRHAFGIAARLCWIQHNRNPDDLVELTPFYLVKCIDAFLRNEKHDNIDKYVTVYMFHTLKRALFEDKIIRIPKSTVDDQVREGMFDSLNVSVQTEAVVLHSLVDLLILRLSPKVRTNLTVNTESDLDLWDTIYSLLEDDEEHRILELKIIGCSDKEIATEIQKSPSYVAKKRCKILHSIKMELSR